MYNNDKKSCNIRQLKTLSLTLNSNPGPRFYQVKLEKGYRLQAYKVKK